MDKTLIESRARLLFPDPIHGNWNDKEDFEFRKEKAKLQRQAYAKGALETFKKQKK